MGCRSYINDPNISPEERDARRQVFRLRALYHHFAVFVAVNIALAAINLITSPARLWFYWPLLGWGIWLGVHAFATFSSGRWLGREWEERKVRELLANKG